MNPFRLAVTGFVLVLLAGTACGDEREDATPSSPTSQGGSSTTWSVESSTTTETAPSSAAPARTAMADLDPYVTAAQRADLLLEAAAAAINNGATAEELRVDQPTADAVSAARDAVSEAGHAIPAGLEPELLRAVLLVQSDLVSRTWAMRPAEFVGTVPLS